MLIREAEIALGPEILSVPDVGPFLEFVTGIMVAAEKTRKIWK